jgi:hypothetical protein
LSPADHFSPAPGRDRTAFLERAGELYEVRGGIDLFDVQRASAKRRCRRHTDHHRVIGGIDREAFAEISRGQPIGVRGIGNICCRDDSLIAVAQCCMGWRTCKNKKNKCADFFSLSCCILTLAPKIFAFCMSKLLTFELSPDSARSGQVVDVGSVQRGEQPLLGQVALRSTAVTCTGVQTPPRAVAMPRAVSALAMARNDCRPTRIYLLNDRQHIGRKAIRNPLIRGDTTTLRLL